MKVEFFQEIKRFFHLKGIFNKFVDTEENTSGGQPSC